MINLEKKFSWVWCEAFGHLTEFFLLDLENCVFNYSLRNQKLWLYRKKCHCGGERTELMWTYR